MHGQQNIKKKKYYWIPVPVVSKQDIALIFSERNANNI